MWQFESVEELAGFLKKIDSATFLKSLTFSKDGRRVYFMSERGELTKIWLKDVGYVRPDLRPLGRPDFIDTSKTISEEA